MEARTMKGSGPASLAPAASLRLWAGRHLIAILLALLVLASWTPLAAEGAGSDAMTGVKSAVDGARKLLGDANYKAAPESGRTELRKLLDSNFDFEAMARSSLGSYWKKLNPQERKHFVELFHQRLERRYVQIIEDYSGAQINFVKESPNGPDRTEVYTNVVNPMLAEPLQINYLLKQKDGVWKIYDLDIGGISEVDSYRKEYAQIINSQGYDALLRKLANPGPT